MIADSDEDERSLLKAILKLKGFHVVEAADGQQALNLATRIMPDLLLVDLRLPRVSGLTVFRHIKNQARLRHLPVVTISYRAANGKRPLAPGVVAQLEKPVELKQLLSVIDRLFPRHAIAA